MVTSCDPGWSLWVHCPIPHGDTTKGSAKAGELLPSPTEQRGVFRGISLFTAGPQSWSLPLVSALRRADLGQHHTKGAPSPVQDQPHASPNPLHLLHPPAPARASPREVSALCPDVPRSPTLPTVGTQSCRAFWGQWLVGRTTAAQPGPGQSRSPAAVAECWLELCPPPPEGFIPLCVL